MNDELSSTRVSPATPELGAGTGTEAVDAATRLLPTDFQVDASTAARSASRFVPVAPLAKGGLGTVSVAFDTQLERRVALKEIRPDRRSDNVRARFLTEAKITGQLEHPGIVPIYSLEADASGEPSYAMRLVGGQTLADAIQDYHARPSPLRFRELLQRFISVCQTMAYAHSKGVVHRDLKPANILLGEYGETLIVDWGLAKRLEADSTTQERSEQPSTLPTQSSEEDSTLAAVVSSEPALTRDGDLLGTPAFMSPEQAEGSRDVGPSTDLYALGAILYQLLVGEPPYRGSTLQILVAVREGRLVPPSKRKKVPPALEAICLKAMATRPADRYGSVRELAAEVERFLAGEPTDAYAEPWTLRCQRWLRRHRTLATATLAALGVAAVAAGVALLFISVKNQQLEQTNRSLAAAQLRTEEALAAEKLRRQQAYGYLEELTSDLVGDQATNRGQVTLSSAQRKSLERALAAFREIAASANQDAEGRLAYGRALQRVGELERRFGNVEASERTLRESIQELTPLVEVREVRESALAALADAQGSLGFAMELRRDLAAGLQLSHESLRTREQLLEFGRSAELVSRLAMQWGNLAMSQEDHGQYREAKASYEKSLEFSNEARRADPTEGRYDAHHARILINFSGLVRQEGNDEQAQKMLAEAIDLLSYLTSLLPHDAATWADLGMAHSNWAAHAHRDGRLDEALAQATRARQCYGRALQVLPGEPEYRRSLAEVLHNIGVIQQDRTELAASIAALQESTSVLQALVDGSPDQLSFRWLLARTYSRLGEALEAQGRLDDALAARSRGVSELEKVLAPGQLAPFDRGVAALHFFELAGLHARRKEDREAIAAYEKARAILTKLVAEHPRHTDEVFLAGTLCNQAKHWLILDPTQMPPLLDEAQRLLEGVLAQDAKHERARRFLSIAWNHRAKFHAAMGNTAAEADALEQARKVRDAAPQ